MAGNMKIGAGLALDGEKEFKQAISGVNKDLAVLASEMKKVTAQFSDNANSMAALTTKGDVLNKQIEEQKKKIDLLKSALENSKEQYGENDKRTKEWQISLNKAEAELARTESELRKNTTAMSELGDESGEASKDIEEVGKSADESGKKFDGFTKIIKSVGAAMGAMAVAAGAAAVKLGKDVIQSFGELEQNLGGSEAVFQDYADKMQKIGEDAYRTMGVTQSEYLATANKMGALFQGSGLDVQKSAELTEQAMQRAADMASVMGIDMQMALDSVAGAAKGNFTMMDNLGVAMNATTIEAYALSKGLDFAWNSASNAEKAEIAMQMFFEKTEQYAGNFERESTQTITGSFGLLKAAASSWVAGLGNASADTSKLTKNMISAFDSVVKNVVPIIKNLTKALPEAFRALLGALKEVLPELLTTAVELFGELLSTMIQMLPELIPIAIDAVLMIVNTLIENLPLLIDGAIQLILGLANGLIQALPELIPAAVKAVKTITLALVNNIDLLIDAAIDLIMALADGLIEALPILIDAVPEICLKLVDALIENAPKLYAAAIQLIIKLGEGIVNNIPRLFSAAWEIVQGIGKAIGKVWETVKGVGKNIIDGIWEGIKSAGDWLWNQIKGFFGGILDKIKNFLGIASPSKVFRDSIGKNLALGIGEGFKAEMGDVTQEMQNAIPTSFDTTINAGVKGVMRGKSIAGVRDSNEINITVVSELDGKAVGYGVTKYVSTQQGFKARKVFA